MPTLFASSHYGSSQFDSGLFRPESAPSLFAFPLARLINGSAMRTVKQNDSYILKVFMADAADRLSGLDGLTLAVTISKPGADFVAISPTQVDRGYGWYDVTLTTSHLDTVGDNVVRATAAGADVSETVIQVRPRVLGDPVTLDASVTGTGFTAIPWNAAWDAEVQSEAADAFAGTEILLSSDAITAMAQGVRTELTVELGRIDAPISESTLSQEAIDDIIDGINEGIAPPRINMRPDPGFTFQVSRRADGTYKCTRPLRIAPGAVETIHPAIDMSPLFGQFNFVQTVGTPSISGGSLTVAAEGARDTYAILEVDGTATASEERTITVVVTMTSGASVQVKLDVEVFDE